MAYPEDRKYSKEHEWVAADGDSATVGITDHAQEQLGDIVDIVLPDVGRKLGKDEALGEIDSVKASSEVFCPVAGEVVEVHDAIVDTPEKVNEDPHGEGWLIKIRLDDPAQLDGLMSAADYEKFIAEG